MHTKDRMVQKLAEVRQQPGEKAENYLQRMKKVITQAPGGAMAGMQERDIVLQAEDAKAVEV